MLQGALTIAFVTNRIEKSQTEDLWRELGDEALKVYDNVNAWKRLLWKNVGDLREDTKLAELVGAQRTIAFSSDLDGYLQAIAPRTGADFLIVRSGASRYTSIISLSDKNLPVPAERYFQNKRNHPYIDTFFLNNTLFFVGTLRITGANGAFVDLFLIKVVDEGLCAQLSFNPRIRVLLSVDSRYSVGSLGASTFNAWLSSHPLLNSYSSIDYLEQDGKPYSAIVQQSGMSRYFITDRGESDEPFYITTFYSRSEYRQRLVSINNTVLSVSLIIALVTMIISLILANSITSPIRHLRKAMFAISAGNYQTVVDLRVSGEMGDLLGGFNDMARQLSQDHTALRKYISEIVHLKEYNDKIFNAIQEGIIVVNALFTIEKVNQAFLRYFNLDTPGVENKNIDDLSIELFDDTFHASIRSVLSGSVPLDTQVRRTSNGLTYEIKMYPLYEENAEGIDRLHCIMIIEDISRRIAYEEGIFQAEKLASISMLSAGVAHEINNPLSSILINVQNLIESSRDKAALSDLRIIEEETKRIGRIVRNLLDFSASKPMEQEGLDINALVEEVLQLIRYSIKKESRIEIETHLDRRLPHVALGSDECKQILINLIKNSLQAIGNDGTIVIRTGEAEEKGRVVLEVADTGCGMSADTQSRLFDPFFTTKGDRGNTGLGLSVVYGIVNKYHGTITVESEEGRGTTMRIELPAQGLAVTYGR